MKSITTLAAGLAAIVLATSPALAQSNGNGDCSTPRGKISMANGKLTLEILGNCPGVSVPRLFPSALQACPHGNVRMEPAKVSKATGGAMTREQRPRGDKRWHVVCDWSAAQAQK